MGNLFGKKKHESRVTEQDKAVLQLKQQRDKLKQYQKKVQVQLEKERQFAKQLLQEGKKERAKLLLRKKKFAEGLLTKTDGQLDNIERMVHDLEYAQIESKVVEGLKVGNASLKKMHELISIDDVERIMDDAQAGIEYQQEIDSILSGGLSDEDEDEVLAELDAIATEEQQPGEDVDISLPDVPVDNLEDIKIQEKTRHKEQPREAMLAS